MKYCLNAGLEEKVRGSLADLVLPVHMQVRVFLSIASQLKGAGEPCALWCLSHSYPFIRETFVRTSVDLCDEQLVVFYRKDFTHLEESIYPEITAV